MNISKLSQYFINCNYEPIFIRDKRIELSGTIKEYLKYQKNTGICLPMIRKNPFYIPKSNTHEDCKCK